METNKLLIILTVIAVLAGAVNMTITLNKLSKIGLIGYATSTGEVNLSIESRVEVNFTDKLINWSSGSVVSGYSIAHLATHNGTVSNGNWTVESTGLTLVNIGNANCTIEIKTGETAASLLGGTSPLYKYNISDNVEPGSCNETVGSSNSTWKNVNTGGNGDMACSPLEYANGADTIRIDIWLGIPSDATGGKSGDTITATATAL